MTIQRRILAGNFAVACLLLVPAVYAVIRLDEVGERTRQSLSSGLDTIREIDRLSSQVEELVQLHRFSPAFRGDAEVMERVEKSLANARATHARLRLRFAGEEGLPSFPQLEAMLREQDFAKAGDADPLAPGSGSPDGSQETGPWSEEGEHLVRQEISAADIGMRRKLLEDTTAIRKDAERTGQIGIMALFITIPLALVSTFIVVRGIHKPLGRLIAATSAVAEGRFGVELAIAGNDEISRLAQAFNKMSTSLAALDRLKADFLSVVAHELKTPLTCIKGYVSALRAEQAGNGLAGAGSEYLERIDREADLLASRVTELLTFGVIEAGQLKLDEREVMTEGFLLMAAEAFRPIATERRIAFAVNVDPGVPLTFFGDPDRLNQVILNLLDNAFKFTPEGGKVVLTGKVWAGKLEIEVQDTGPGIPQGQLETIFEKYARAQSGSGGVRGGTGLGLAVARGIVLAHGGAIDARSEPGHGSRFRVRLPLVAASARRAMFLLVSVIGFATSPLADPRPETIRATVSLADARDPERGVERTRTPETDAGDADQVRGSGPHRAEPDVVLAGVIDAAWTPAETAMSARKALAAARSALDNGRDRDALRLYELVLLKEPLSGSRRAEALYESGILQAAPDPAIRNFARARRRLEEFSGAYPRNERRVEAASVLALIGDIERGLSEAAALRDSIAIKDMSCAAEKEHIEAQFAASGDEARALRKLIQTQLSEIQTLRSEAQALRAEIGKRDETLRKVKEALVGRKASR